MRKKRNKEGKVYIEIRDESSKDCEWKVRKGKK
jgi:hypothetical protein